VYKTRTQNTVGKYPKKTNDVLKNMNHRLLQKKQAWIARKTWHAKDVRILGANESHAILDCIALA
jgi:hypothetical protein